MKFTLSWLKEHLDTTASLEEIGRTLTMIGLEIESIHNPAAELADFIVGEVTAAGPHPDADKLKLCTVSTGSETLQIVCGAPNARAGLKVVLARPGCTIPATGDVLKKGKIRGVESQGMMCSSRELNLGDDHAGIIELPAETPVGAPITSVLPTDPVIEIAVTPNRADCLGVRGVARDLAAAGLGRLKPAPRAGAVPGTFHSPIAVGRWFPEGQDDACPLFVGRYVRGVKNGESPQWLKDRLTAIGLRPISALVDITNFVTMDRARPLHVFDAAKVRGGVVGPRFAKAGESLDALNDKHYTLDESVIAIADAEGVLGIGGVVGGEYSGCTEDTTDVFIESALFDAHRIATIARTLGIESDAKHRFERGVDPESAVDGAELATALILDLCGGEASEILIGGTLPAPRSAIAFRPARVAQIVGIDVPVADMRGMLERLGCTVEGDENLLQVTPPSWRGDLAEEHDLVEEIARLYGYDNIPAVPLPRPPMPRPVLTPRQRQTRAIGRALAMRGMLETVTWSFLPQEQAEMFGGGAEDLKLANPISADLDALRPSILPNLMSAAARNAARGFGDVALFEIGPQFHGGEPGEQKLVAAGLRAGSTGPRHWNTPPRPVDAFDAKADARAALATAGVAVDNLQVSTTDAPGYYHPGRSGCLRLGPKVLAQFGELHPALVKALDLKGAVVGFEVFLEDLPLPKAKPTRARPLLKASPFQPLERDFAFVVDSTVPAEALIRAARGADRGLITDVAVFDLYEGANMPEGKKSLALSVTLQPTTKTFTDTEIEAVSTKIIAAIEKATGGILRG